MDTSLVFVKTEKGHEEIDRRSYRLSFKQRAALIVVDGANRAESLLQKIPGDGLVLLEALWRDGFIAPIDGQTAKPAEQNAVTAAAGDSAFDMEAAKRNAVKAIEAILGPNGESLAMAIERTKTRSEFSAQAQKTRDIVRAMGGQRRADEFWGKTGL